MHLTDRLMWKNSPSPTPRRDAREIVPGFDPDGVLGAVSMGQRIRHRRDVLKASAERYVQRCVPDRFQSPAFPGLRSPRREVRLGALRGAIMSGWRADWPYGWDRYQAPSASSPHRSTIPALRDPKRKNDGQCAILGEERHVLGFRSTCSASMIENVGGFRLPVGHQ